MKEPRYHILLCLLGTSVPEAVQDLSRTLTETCTHLQEVMRFGDENDSDGVIQNL